MLVQRQVPPHAPMFFVIHEEGHDWQKPARVPHGSFSFDTEARLFYDGKLVSEEKLQAITLTNDAVENRTKIKTDVWCWLVYDDVNGFFASNSFELLLQYCCKCGYKKGWCYNSKYDFSQIDYAILNPKAAHKWKLYDHEHEQAGKTFTGRRCTYKAQPYTYEQLNGQCGTRYSYKLWMPYRDKTRHVHVHAVQIMDFMNIMGGGLASVLKSLDVHDEKTGEELRKLEFGDYQVKDPLHLTKKELAYLDVDVRGLFYAVKKLNKELEELTDGESHIFGPDTNRMTAGGIAKAALLQSMYPNASPKNRLKIYQKEHPISTEFDKYFRERGGYAGGLVTINPKFKGKSIESDFYRYDVNSLYPSIMHDMEDLGEMKRTTWDDWCKNKNEYKKTHVAMFEIEGLEYDMKPGMIPCFYDLIYKEPRSSGLYRGQSVLLFEEYFTFMAKNFYDFQMSSVKHVFLFKKLGKRYARYVDKFYPLKSEAKKAGNKAKAQMVKIFLNSAYGKLSEKREAVTILYGYDKRVAACRPYEKKYDQDKQDELNEKKANQAMSVACGAYVTALAKMRTLTYALEIYGNKMGDHLAYIDTDSLHGDFRYDKADPSKLGALKEEAHCCFHKNVLAKTYIEVACEARIGKDKYQVTKDGAFNNDVCELHCKGISCKAIKDELTRRELEKGYCTSKDFTEVMAYGKTYPVLTSLNVSGGKALVMVHKELAKIARAPKDYIAAALYEARQGILAIKEE